MLQTFRKTAKGKDGANLYYETYIVDGGKPAVFFVHGAGGDVDAWQYVRDELLNKGVSSVAMDLRGHGYSTHPYAFAGYRMEKFVEDIAVILDREKIEKLFLVGHSFGATVALCFALRYPEKLKSLAIISGTYHQPGYLRSKTLTAVSRLVMKVLALFSPPPIFPGHSVYPPGKFHKDYEWFGLTKTILRNSWRSYLLTNQQIFTLDIGSRLESLTAPTLLIVGEKDSIFPLPISKIMHDKIKNSKLEIIPEANHVVILNNVAQIADSLHRFLKETDQSKP